MFLERKQYTKEEMVEKIRLLSSKSIVLFRMIRLKRWLKRIEYLKEAERALIPMRKLA